MSFFVFTGLVLATLQVAVTNLLCVYGSLTLWLTVAHCARVAHFVLLCGALSMAVWLSVCGSLFVAHCLCVAHCMWLFASHHNNVVVDSVWSLTI